MNSKTYGIGILSVTAVVLLIAQFIPLRPAVASEAIKDRDYSIVTARTNAGGDALYVTDSRTGLIAAFLWDPGRREVVVKDVRPVNDAFQ